MYVTFEVFIVSKSIIALTGIILEVEINYKFATTITFTIKLIITSQLSENIPIFSLK